MIGYIQEIPGGLVFELGNGWLSRRIHCIAGRIGTTSLTNEFNGEEYLEETLAEFEIVITGEGQRVTLDSRDFILCGYETPNWDNSRRTLALRLEADINDTKLRISVFYEIAAGDNFMRKWVEIEPCELENWTIRSVVIEKMLFRELVEGVQPKPRYRQTYPSGEDKVQAEPDTVDVSEPDKRLIFGDSSRAALTYWGYGEGLFFFTESLTGSERFHRPTGLVMKHRDFAALSSGTTTGPAVIGAYSGPPELGFKRYNEHLMKHWCVVDFKPVPAMWNTWLITLPDDKPLHTNFDRRFLLGVIDKMKDAGFYDALHLDLGWEAKRPLSYDEDKFPNGLSEIARRAKDAAGLDMAFWINPFSCSYWKSQIERQHPEYVVPGKVSGRSHAAGLCIMTEYYDYVRQRIIDLAVGLNARAIYWDGNDWNIPNCSSDKHDHLDQEELEVTAMKRLAEICRSAHEARPDLILAAFSLPFDNHRLCALDCQSIADTHSFETVKSELVVRQQIYQMTYEHPYRAIWSNWYGINWHEAGKDNLTQRPMLELKHALMSMIGSGLLQAGGSIDLNQASRELVEFLGRLFAFRKRFARYFDVYQHVLGFPDGENVDGAGHIVDGSGFIVLVNPTRDAKEVRLPLDEPELELNSGKHRLSDWGRLTDAVALDPATLSDPPIIELAPLEVRYIGVNIDA